MLDQITPLIITYNEAVNIRRTLDKLVWARRIVVVDSGSTDETISILQSYSQVEVVHHAFSDFASQCNVGLTQITTPWVLSLDADYELSDALIAELQTLAPAKEVAGFLISVSGSPAAGPISALFAATATSNKVIPRA